MLIKDIATLEKKVLPWLRKIKRCKVRWKRAVALDTETYAPDDPKSMRMKNEGLLLDRGRIMLISLSRRNVSFSIPLHAFDTRFPKASEVIKRLRPFLRSKILKKVCHHLNYDDNMFRNHGVVMRNRYCTMVAGACWDENKPRALVERAVEVGHILKKANKAVERKVLFTDLSKLAPYAEGDSQSTWDLYEAHTTGSLYDMRDCNPKDIAKMKLHGRREMFRKLEMQVLDVVIAMERAGTLIDRKKLDAIDRTILDQLNISLNKIYKINGAPFNVNSKPQLCKLLYDKLDLDPHKQTATGQNSTDRESLLYMKGQHKVVEMLLEVSKLEKLRSYTNPEAGLQAYADRYGYIHPTLSSVGTITFRFSCSNPNLQNIPSRMDRFGIRKCFIAPHGHVMVVADYSQLELRLMGIMSEDRMLLRAYRKGLDIHDQTMKALKISVRTIAKNCNFGLSYKGSAWMLARLLTMDGIPTTPEEASVYRDGWLDLYSGIPRFWDDIVRLHHDKGYVLNLAGRPRYVADLYTSNKRTYSAAVRQLINNIIQGSASDWIKPAMIRISNDRYLRELGYVLRLQIHDELVGTCPEKNAEKVAARKKELMEMEPENGVIKKLPIPILASVGIGPSWAEAKS